MKNPIRTLVATAALAAAASGASAAVLTFEDLYTTAGVYTGFFNAPYTDGFVFGNFGPSQDWFWSVNDGNFPMYVSHSGHFSVSTDINAGFDANKSSAITNATPFLFQGAYFSACCQTVQYELWLGGVLKGTATAFDIAANFADTQSKWYANDSAYTGPVDKVVILGPTGNWAMDDFTYTLAPNPVPEPSTYALMAGGLGLVAFMARRRKEKAAA